MSDRVPSQSYPSLAGARRLRLLGLGLLAAAAWLLGPGPTLAGELDEPAAPSPRALVPASGDRGRATPRLASSIRPGSVDRTSVALEATYDVRVVLRYGVGSMSVTSDMTVRNTSGGPIDRLELNTVAARLGRIRLTHARIDGRAVRVTISDQTLRVPLGGVLPAGETAAVHLAFHAWFRRDTIGSNWLFGRSGGVLAAYRWLPWVSRVHSFTRPNHGDPFVTPVSPSVRVRITTDRPMRLATSGQRVASAGLTQTFVARSVRDFTITASPSYRIMTGTSGNTRVQVFYLPGTAASTMLSWARRALAQYSALVGAYPYPNFTVAVTAGGYGMESPALIWIPRGVEPSRLSYLVSHETAHQWFYAAVGNDQASEPFADEALADFLARYTLNQRRSSACRTDTLDRTIYRYSGSCYYEVVYIQGGAFLEDLRRRMGSAAFWRAIRTYYATYRFRLSGTRNLLTALDEGTPLNLVIRYRPRFPRYY